MYSNQLKSIALVGATGLVGGRLLELLLADPTVQSVVVPGRRPLEIEHPKIRFHLSDLSPAHFPAEWLKGVEVVYCCLGTTIKKAGSRDKFRSVDYEMPLLLARRAAEAGVKKMVVVSSVGANPLSTNFYLKVKGEMERDIQSSTSFQKLAFVRPSVLLGLRPEFRWVEQIGKFVLYLLSPLLRGGFARYRPIHDFTVAKAMVAISHSVSKQHIYESHELSWLGK
jgi:uncharacterized protein YbjT (DUF2867 family)